MRSLFLIINVAILLSSCGSGSDNPDQDPMVASWKVSKYDLDETIDNVVSNDLNLITSLKDGFLRFYPDQTLVVWQKDIGYSVNRWEYSKKNGYYLLSGPIFTQGLSLKELKREEKQAKFRLIDSKNQAEGIDLFLAAVPLYEVDSTDLLHPSHNQWRIKPKQAETPQQLKKRVLGMVTFIIDYFELTDKKEQPYFETPILQSPFLFYSGGIGVASAQDLPTEWTKTFFDEQDALKGHKILLDAFDTDTEYPSNIKKHTEGYLKVLKAVKFNLE
ncbi:hypothetical protein P1X15_01600 [Runella sp. MFBS21]|uniref:hypothetical protein n=1 Tax=Runella sp. MFBS21 TaxID=3034018 RepID=UPI0023F97253|nr:hypothetical protein [Runella sp. MFBS21]MDF7816260.1 hypothetical protein [Runella sp. MFBS21]